MSANDQNSRDTLSYSSSSHILALAYSQYNNCFPPFPGEKVLRKTLWHL